MVSRGRGPPRPSALAIRVYGTCGHHRHGNLSKHHSGASGTGWQPTAAPIQKDGRRGEHRMSRSKSDSLLGLTESFFHSYLQHTRGASAHTVRAYRDSLKLFYLFLAQQNRTPAHELALAEH